MDPVPPPPPSDRSSFDRADATTRSARQASLHALQVAEYALSAPAPRRERTWLHRSKMAVDALADAIDQQIRHDDDSIGLLAEIALSEPDHADAVIDLRNEQRALRVAVASLGEQLEDGADFLIDTTNIRSQLGKLAHWYRQHQTTEAELIHAALDIDVTDGTHPSPGLDSNHDRRRSPMTADTDLPFDANEADVVEQHRPVADGFDPDIGLPNELSAVDVDPADALDQHLTIPDDDDDWPIEPPQ